MEIYGEYLLVPILWSKEVLPAQPCGSRVTILPPSMWEVVVEGLIDGRIINQRI